MIVTELGYLNYKMLKFEDKINRDSERSCTNCMN